MQAAQLAPQNIRAIAPYQPGKPLSELAREFGISDAVKLASNENPRGASDRVAPAVARAMGEVGRYPDGNGFELKAALASKHEIGMDRIVLGNGSNDVLELAARAFLAPGLSAVYAQYAFTVYPLATQASGARSIVVAARAYAHDLDAMGAAVEDSTRVLFVANPNNPTGTLAAPSALASFLRRIPEHAVIVLDEAYHEYLAEDEKSDSRRWLEEFPNLIVTRTFSKAYGLAGLRVGYALCSAAVADLLNRVRQPFNVSNVAQAAAIAALEDEAFVAESAALNRRGIEQLVAGFTRLGLPYIATYGNFITVHVGDAQAVYGRLLAKGVIVRPLAGYGLREHLRISVGLADENERCLTALAQVLAASR